MRTLKYEIRQDTLDDGRVLLERFRNHDVPSIDAARVNYDGGPPTVMRAMALASELERPERRALAHKTKENMLRLELACRGLLLPDDFFEDGRFDLLERGDQIRSALLAYAAGERGDDDVDEDYDTEDYE